MQNWPQLFLLHFAGGHAYSYDFLERKIRNVAVNALELPGRGKRYREDFLISREKAVEDYVAQIQKKRNGQPYIIYGHSMGAILGLNVAKRLEDAGDPPAHLIVSGNAGPGVKELSEGRKRKVFLMDDNEFKNELRELGGTPVEILENAELYNFFSPILRADFRILEKEGAGLEKGPSIKTPIYALMGSEERTSSQIENWRNFTSADFQFQILSGGHFFIYDHPTRLAGIIQNCFEKRQCPM